MADNGSSDGSTDVARLHGARVVQVAIRGYGSALQAGIAAARSNYVIMGDADESYDFSQLEPFVRRLRAGDEVVVGNRFQGGIQPGAMPWLHRYIGNPILSGLLNLFFHTPVHDAHCGLRAVRKDTYERLRMGTTGMEFASEMIVKASLHDVRMSEVPITLYPDGRDRPPHLRSFRDGWRHLRFLLLLCPLWLYLIPSGLLLTAGLGLMMWLTLGPQAVSGFVQNIHGMLCGTVCVLVGYQALWLWAFATIFGWKSGLLPQETVALRIVNYLSLERGLIAGITVLIASLGLYQWLHGWCGNEWSEPDMRPRLCYSLWGFTTMVVGVQTIYSSVFLCMLGMDKENRQ